MPYNFWNIWLGEKAWFKYKCYLLFVKTLKSLVWISVKNQRLLLPANYCISHVPWYVTSTDESDYTCTALCIYIWLYEPDMSSCNLVLPYRQSSLKSVASCSLPMTRKSAKTTASSPPIRTAKGETESQSGQESWLLPHFLQQLFGMRRGGHLKRNWIYPEGKWWEKEGRKEGWDDPRRGLFVLNGSNRAK